MSIESEHRTDADGNPAGGRTTAPGLLIDWQAGPLGPPDENGVRPGRNGAFIEDVIWAAIDRLRYHQRGKFACGHNRIAIGLLEGALEMLDARTTARVERGVEGTHAP